MSSLNDNDFEAKLDGLLAETVHSGAEPSDLSLSFPPRRPRFRGVWVSAGMLAGLIFFAGLVLLVVQDGAVVSSAGRDLGAWFHDAILMLVAPERLVYTGLVAVAVYYFLFTRLARMLRFA